MKLKAIAAVAAGAVGGAAGAGTAAYAMFKKLAVRNDGKEIYEIDMGTDWKKYMPFIIEKREWLASSIGEEYFIKSRDGLLLAGKYIPAPEPTHKTVIAVHGYRSCGTYEFAAISEMYHRRGFNVLLVDNRAHGDSEGKYIGFGVLDCYDLKCWVDYFCENIDPDAEIYLHGISMGGTTVLLYGGIGLSANVRGIISDCAFTNAYDVIQSIFAQRHRFNLNTLIKAASAVCKVKAGYAFDEMSTADAVPEISVPALFIHGSSDVFVPTEMSKANYSVCKSRKRLLIIPGAGHAECFYHSPKTYEKHIFEFFGI